MNKAGLLWNFIRFSLTFLFLMGVWILLSGSFTLYSLLMGIAGTALISLITYKIFIPSHQASARYLIAHPLFLIWYLLVMIYLLYKSSFHTCKAVFTGTSTPRIVHFRTRLRSDAARMLLSLSITITPGTICLDLNDDHLSVHWLLADTSHNKESGEKIKGFLERTIGRVFA
ncbi:MAG: Na+/H+ antiporter subunit E [Sphaerochaetaceae bacterium]|nr:Na+/H+ antiporter subunit E [Sphaerochaetaceae bacterium]